MIQSILRWNLSDFQFHEHQQEVGEDKCKNLYSYGKRWTLEIYFSGLKGAIGEMIRTKRTDDVIHRTLG